MAELPQIGFDPSRAVGRNCGATEAPAAVAGLVERWLGSDATSVRFITKAVLLTWFPAQGMAFTVAHFFPGPATGLPPFDTILELFLVAVIAGPLLETLLMRWIFSLLRKSPRVGRHACNIMTLLALAGHNPSTSWGVGAGWSFWIFSHCYLIGERRSRDTAFLVVAVIHILFNFLSFIGTLVEAGVRGEL